MISDFILLTFRAAIALMIVGCAHTAKQKSPEAPLITTPTEKGQAFEIEGIPKIKNTPLAISYGGFSGLAIAKETETTITFVTLTDRGPNGELTNKKLRPFAVPQFAPSLVYFEHTKSTGRTKLSQIVPIRLDSKTQVTGLPNHQKAEQPVDLNLKSIADDPNGLDSEGVAIAPDGSIWICDEYGPSIVKLDAQGQWLKRFVPEGEWVKGMKNTAAILPIKLAQKRKNRGFEALAFEGQTLYAFMQSPVEKGSRDLMIIEFDTAKEKVVAQHTYIMADTTVEKIGDVVALGNQTFLAIELDDQKGPQANKYIQWIDLKNKRSKRLLHLPGAGFTYSQKAEGLAYSQRSHKLYVLNDNDFNIGTVLHPDSLHEIEPSKLFTVEFHLR